MEQCPQQPRSIHEILCNHTLHRGDHIAVVDGGRRISYRELSEQVDRLAKILVAKGVRHGDRVATLAVPGIDFWLSFLAATSIGAIWLGLNPKYRSSEIAHILHDADPHLVLVQPWIDGRDVAAEFAPLGFPQDRLLSFADHPVLQSVYADEPAENAAGIDLAPLRLLVTAEDIALIVYTSGTTGRPKGAMLSHRAVVASARINSGWMAGRISSTISAAPINHVGAVNNRCMVVFYAGGKITFMPRPDYSRLEELIAAEGCSFHHFNPTTLAMLIDHPASAHAARSTAQVVLIGGGTIPEELLRQLNAPQGSVVNVYGQTETAGIVTRTDFCDSIHAIASTIGKPIEECEARITAVSGGLAGPGEAGEIELRGPVLMSGYFRNPAASAEAMTADGWLKTGDIGRWDADCNLVFVGRRKEMYKSGGYNIYPAEIELALTEHPAVAAAVVVPVKDSLYQEVGHAFVLPCEGVTPTNEELKDFLRARIANYKIPKTFTFLAELPLLPSMKVDRSRLRELAQAG